MRERKDIGFKLAEKIVKQLYEIDNIKIMYLMIAKDHNMLNEQGLFIFLKNYPKNDELISLLKEINRQKKLLPDFILLDASNKVFFVEVKNWNKKVTLNKIDQKEAIKKLADNGFSTIIKNVTIDYRNIPPEQINHFLDEYGSIMKGEVKGEQIYFFKIFSEERQRESYHNVSIWNLIVEIK